MAELTQDGLAKAFYFKLVNKIDASWWNIYSQSDNEFNAGFDKVKYALELDPITSEDLTSATDYSAIALSESADTSAEYGFLTKLWHAFNPRWNDLNLAYDKAPVIMQKMVNQSNEFLAEFMAYTWTTEVATSLVPTSNTSTRGNVYGNTLIKQLDYQDFLAANAILDAQKVPREGRIFVCNSDMLRDIKSLDAFNNSDVLKTSILMTGVVEILDGVKIITRETNNVFAAGGAALQAFEATPGATDLGYGLLYHPEWVRKSVGTDNSTGVNFLMNQVVNSGGGFNFEGIVRYGATIAEQTLNTGIVAIVESK